MTARHDWLLPKKFNTYFEPFLGGGAVLFHLQPKKAVLTDLNADLIASYKAVKKDWHKIQQLLNKHQRDHSEDHYYTTRRLRFADDLSEAARFIYLNRACFNGIYRVNLKGEFNVPKGSKESIILDGDDFRSIAHILRKCQLAARDFEETVASAASGDFVFVDPPYTVKHNNNGFIKYNQNLFAWEDQIRLRNSVAGAAARGAMILVTNANHQSVRDIYKGMGEMHKLDRASIVSAASEHRRLSSELAITIGYSANELIIPEPPIASNVRAAR